MTAVITSLIFLAWAFRPAGAGLLILPTERMFPVELSRMKTEKGLSILTDGGREKHIAAEMVVVVVVAAASVTLSACGGEGGGGLEKKTLQEK